MILAIDMGNINTAIDGVDETKTYFIERVTTDQGHTGIEYAVSPKNILGMHRIDIASIEGAILSSAVPPVNSTISNVVEKVIGTRPLLVGSGMKIGMNIAMGNPETAGSDQIVDAVAASHERSLLLVVIDMGTVTTLCTVDEKGNHVGGAIPPGLKASLNSLSSRTAQLPCISLEVPSHVVGRNAVGCMRSGIVYGNTGTIDEILDRMGRGLGGPPTITATDGPAKFITPLYRHKIVVDDVLPLKGLLILHRKSTEVH